MSYFKAARRAGVCSALLRCAVVLAAPVLSLAAARRIKPSFPSTFPIDAR